MFVNGLTTVLARMLDTPTVLPSAMNDGAAFDTPSTTWPTQP